MRQHESGRDVVGRSVKQFEAELNGQGGIGKLLTVEQQLAIWLLTVIGFGLMREAALRPVWKRRFIHTTDSRHDLPVAENLLNRQFETEAPNQAWVSDISVPQQAA